MSNIVGGDVNKIVAVLGGTYHKGEDPPPQLCYTYRFLVGEKLPNYPIQIVEICFKVKGFRIE